MCQIFLNRYTKVDALSYYYDLHVWWFYAVWKIIAASHESLFSPTELRYGLKEDLLGFGESNIELWFEGGEKSALAV